MRAETIAMFRELQASIREELGGGDVDDDLLLHEIMRRALGGGGAGGSGEEGGEDVRRAPYQVAVSRCDTCKLVSIDAAGESFPVDAAVENIIGCDAQEIPHVGANKRATQTVPPAKRREVMRRERNCCAMPGCRKHRHLHVHHVKPRSEGGDHDLAFLVPLCHRHNTRGSSRIRPTRSKPSSKQRFAPPDLSPVNASRASPIASSKRFFPFAPRRNCPSPQFIPAFTHGLGRRFSVSISDIGPGPVFRDGP